MSTQDITPVRVGERWIDDGSPIELWSEDGDIGLGLEVVLRNSPGTPELAMRVQRLGDDEPVKRAIAIYDPVAAELRGGAREGEALASSDLALLRSRLDATMLAGLAQRARRLLHVADRQSWKEGDAPRAALGSRISFADVFPYAWDLVATHEDRRYALIDRYLLDRRAEHRACEIEVVDLATGAAVGVVEVASGRRSKAKLQHGASAAQRIVQQFRDGGGWRGLRRRVEEIARVARRLETWSEDLRDPAVPVRELLRTSVMPARDLRDRVEALGVHAAPSLREALAEPSGELRAACTAAQVLARCGDPAGIPHLIRALRERDLDEEVGRSIDALGALAGLGIEPLLAAFNDERDLEIRDRLLEALVATGIEDERIVALVLDAVRRDVFVADMLADYGYGGAAVIEGLSELLAERLRVLEDGVHGDDDELIYDEAAHLEDVLADLGALDKVSDERTAAAAGKLAARDLAPGATPGEPYEQDFDDSEDIDIDVLPPSMPVRVEPRPGRNDPCRCGSGKKYKKCHWAEDVAVQHGTP